MSCAGLTAGKRLGLVVSLFLGACPSSDPAFPVEVLFSRCARVFRGPACELAADRVVVLWVATTTLELSVSGERRRELREDGTSIEVVVPAGATELLLRTPRKRPFRLALAPSVSSPVLDRALALKKEGQLAEARAVLGALSTASPELELRARSLLARLALAEGRGDEAIATFTETANAHERMGHVSEALLDGEALAWALLHHGRRFTEARAALERLRDAALVDPEGAVQLPYYQAIVFSESGDVRSALQALRIAEARARRLSMSSFLGVTEQVLVLQLDALGRHDEALARLERAAQTPPDDPCQHANLLTNLGWTSLQAARPRATARSYLERATERFATSCPRSIEEANALTNLALAALLEGDLAGAAHALARSRASAPDDARLELWRIDLDARLELLRRRPQAALAAFQRLQRLAEAAVSPEAAWRAAVGQGRAFTQLQQPAAALEAYRRAEAVLDDEYRRLPLGEGLHTLLSEREGATGELLELLVSRGRPDEALAVARHARTRALRHLAIAEHVSRLEPGRRERWERAVASHAAARAALDRAARLDWQLAADALKTARASRSREERAVEAALDAALAELAMSAENAGADAAAGMNRVSGDDAGPKASSNLGAGDAPSLRDRRGPLPGASDGSAQKSRVVDAAASGRGAREARPVEALRPVERGELLLLVAPGARGELVFSATAGRVSVRALEASPDDPPHVVAEALFGPNATELAAAEHVSWLPRGRWRELDLRALPVDGQPLGASKRVSWRIDVPRRRAGASSLHGALVVSDPTNNLPGTRDEAARVRPLLEGPTTHLEGASATPANVRERMHEALVFHYAGHAMLAGLGGFESELTLHEGRLTAADVITLPRAVPPLVVLSGCETGKSAGDGLEALGLAQAFVLAGADEVVATERPLDDRLAAAAMECLHQRRPAMGTAEALRAAFLHRGCEGLRSYRLYGP